MHLNWNAKDNAGTLYLTYCVCATSKCNNCRVHMWLTAPMLSNEGIQAPTGGSMNAEIRY